MKKNIYLFEAIFAIAVIFALNYFLKPDDLGFLSYKLHPYLFITILIASRYGLKPGSSTGLLTAIVYIGFVYYKEQIFTLRLLFEFNTYFLPIIFIITGTFLGELREKYKQKYLYTLSKKKEIEDTYKTALDNIKILKQTNSELEKQIVGNFSTFSVLYEASRGLDTLQIEKVYKAVEKICSKHLHFNAFSMYVKTEDKYECAVKVNPKDLSEVVTELPELTRLAIEKQKIISIREIIDAENPDEINKDILLAAPLIDSNRNILGFIEVYDLPFLQLNPNMIKMLTMVIEWISKSLENIKDFELQKQKNIVDENLNIYTYEYFKKRIKEEFERSRQYAMPLSLAVLTIVNFDKIGIKNKIKILKIINNIFDIYLSDIDIVSKYKKENQVSIMFIAKGIDETREIITGIKKEIDSFNLKPYEDSEESFNYRIVEDTFSMDDKSSADLEKRIEDKF